MTHVAISAVLDQTKACGGWDAICALGAERLNALFFQQYLDNGPTSPDVPLRFVLPVSGGGSFVLADLLLGPPAISIPAEADANTAHVTMIVVRGRLITFDPDAAAITEVAMLDPKASSITGQVNLDRVTGKVDEVGQVTLDLSGHAYTPKVEGIAPDSELATELGAAIGGFFAARTSQYVLGTIVSGDTPDALTPVAFDIVTQPDPSGQTAGCVNLLIQTTGTGGERMPPPTYPIPKGSTAALFVANEVLFGRLFPPYLTDQFSETGTVFAGRPDGDGTVTVSSGGSLGIGKFEDNPRYDTRIFSSDSRSNETAVSIPFAGVTISPKDGQLAVDWSASFAQNWTKAILNARVGWMNSTQSISLKAGHKLRAGLDADPETNVISFNGAGETTFSAPNRDSFWEQLLGFWDIPKVGQTRIRTALSAILDQLKLPDVNAFSLTSLLFPGHHAISLTDASLPLDLFATGQVRARIAVSPAEVTLAPGASLQFTATGADGTPLDDVLWQVSPPSAGTIDASGTFTAATGGTQDNIAVVRAINRQVATQTAGSLVRVSVSPDAQGALRVSPGRIMAAPGAKVHLTVTDASGAKVDADMTRSPEVGVLTKGFLPGDWIFVAPTELDGAQQVTLAAAHGSQSGTATVDLAEALRIAVSPADSAIKAGGSVTLSVAEEGAGAPVWSCYAPGGGQIVPDPKDPTKAVFTAPEGIAADATVMVVATVIDETMALGLSRITIKAE